MGTATKHPVPDRVKPSFVIFDIRALWRSAPSVRVPGLMMVVSFTCIQYIRYQIATYYSRPQANPHSSSSWFASLISPSLSLSLFVRLRSCPSVRPGQLADDCMTGIYIGDDAMWEAVGRQGALRGVYGVNREKWFSEGWVDGCMYARSANTMREHTQRLVTQSRGTRTLPCHIMSMDCMTSWVVLRHLGDGHLGWFLCRVSAYAKRLPF